MSAGIYRRHPELVPLPPDPKAGFELREFYSGGYQKTRFNFPEELMGHLAALLLDNTTDGIRRLTAFHNELGIAIAEAAARRINQ